MFKLEGRDQKAEEQIYPNSKLQISFSGRIQRHLHIYHAKRPALGNDIVYLTLRSERIQSGRCSL